MKATREGYGRALVTLANTNPNVVALEADLGGATKSKMFQKEAPERYFDMGIAEANMIGTAAGLATCGKIPFASTFAMFATGRVYDQIRNSVAYPHLSVKIVGTHAGISVGPDGGTHQVIEDISLMRTIPGMTVVNPADEEEAYQAVLAAAEYDGPVYLRLSRQPSPAIHEEGYQFQIGKGEVLRGGADVAIIACGLMVPVALEAADQLAAEGIDARVINMHTIKPLDEELVLAAAAETGAIVTAEEHNVVGGLGATVAELLAKKAPTKMAMVGVNDVFGKSGTGPELFEEYGLTAEHIAAEAKALVASK